MASLTSTRTPVPSKTRDERPARRKKEARGEIWSSLLRQTREAQARSRTHAVQTRELIVCGGSADDQRSFVQTLARPPPPAPVTGRNSRDGRERRPKGEVVLSNRFAYGYGHVTLFSPPPQGAGLLGSDSEEVAKVGIHTVSTPDVGYEATLRRLLQPGKRQEGVESEEGERLDDMPPAGEDSTEMRPSVALLLNWKEPWKFLDLLRRWLQLLARALLQPNGPREDPIEVLKEHKLSLTVVVQHVEEQEALERENYKEESFDYISQCLRTCLLPLSAALVYTPSAMLAPLTAQGAPLTEIQKVLYTSLGLDPALLSAKTTGTGATVKKEDLGPKHNVVDRMAIVVPSGWDSVGKIRLLSETFSPEAVTEGWMADINTPVFPAVAVPVSSTESDESEQKSRENGQANGDGEQYTFETVGASPAPAAMPDWEMPPSPTKIAKSAILTYGQQIQDPQAHKAPQQPRIEVTTKPEQEFLAEMRTQLQMLEEKDRERQKREPGSVPSASTTGGGRGMTIPGGESSGALNNLGDVQFNVGGVNYNAATAEAAIERLKRPAQAESPRTGTPRPPKREDREGGRDTPRTAEIDTDKLEEYFHSLMKRGGGGSSQSTPSKAPPASGSGSTPAR